MAIDITITLAIAGIGLGAYYAYSNGMLSGLMPEQGSYNVGRYPKPRKIMIPAEYGDKVFQWVGELPAPFAGFRLLEIVGIQGSKGVRPVQVVRGRIPDYVLHPLNQSTHDDDPVWVLQSNPNLRWLPPRFEEDAGISADKALDLVKDVERQEALSRTGVDQVQEAMNLLDEAGKFGQRIQRGGGVQKQ